MHWLPRRTRPVVAGLIGMSLLLLVGCAGCIRSAVNDGSNITITYSPLYSVEEVEDIGRLAKNSALVVEGDVLNAASAATAVLDRVPNNGQEMVYRDFTLSISRVLKGSARAAGDSVTVRVLGGTDGDLTVDMGGSQPQLDEGDRVLLFLSDAPTPECPTSGGFEYMVYGDGFGSFEIHGDRAVRDVAGQGPNDDLPLEDLRKRVLEVAVAP